MNVFDWLIIGFVAASFVFAVVYSLRGGGRCEGGCHNCSEKDKCSF